MSNDAKRRLAARCIKQAAVLELAVQNAYTADLLDYLQRDAHEVVIALRDAADELIRNLDPKEHIDED